MSKLAQGFVDGNETRWVQFDREILELDQEECETNVSKLAQRFNIENSKDRSVIGVVITKKLLILLHENNTFSGIIWERRHNLSGGYTLL